RRADVVVALHLGLLVLGQEALERDDEPADLLLRRLGRAAQRLVGAGVHGHRLDEITAAGQDAGRLRAANALAAAAADEVGARAHERGLGAQHLRDGVAGRLVQLVEVDQRGGRLAHGLQRLRPQARAAVARGGAGAVDDGTHAQPLIDHARPSSFMERIAVAKAATVSLMTSSVWQVLTSPRPPLKSTFCRISAWRRARLRAASLA